jgi:hypothetical protein
MAGVGLEAYAARSRAIDQRRVQRVRDEARYMAELVTDLLDLGKIEAGSGRRRSGSIAFAQDGS